VRSLRSREGRRRSLHGIACNVNCNLEAFDAIIPCGLTSPVTSLAALGVTASPEEVAAQIGEAIARAIAGGRPVRAQAVRTGPAGGDDLVPVSLRRLDQAGVDRSRAVSISQRKPSWLRRPAALSASIEATRQTLRAGELVTVCEEAGCPNRAECWADGTATFMVNGERCTRRCGFCQVDTRRPGPLDPSEPERVADAVVALGLDHAVITCVARDDLADGGAAAIAATIGAIRARAPEVAVEVLVSDCGGDPDALEVLYDATPEVFNHNLETVARLQRAVRPSAGYARSLAVLAGAASRGLTTKSGIMVGLGETDEEVAAALADLAAVGVSIATIGQYLRPSAAHLPVARYVEPAQFDRYAELGRALGLRHVEAGPLVRSSYHARRAAAAVQPVTLARR